MLTQKGSWWNSNEDSNGSSNPSWPGYLLRLFRFLCFLAHYLSVKVSANWHLFFSSCQWPSSCVSCLLCCFPIPSSWNLTTALLTSCRALILLQAWYLSMRRNPFSRLSLSAPHSLQPTPALQTIFLLLWHSHTHWQNPTPSASPTFQLMKPELQSIGPMTSSVCDTCPYMVLII